MPDIAVLHEAKKAPEDARPLALKTGGLLAGIS